MDLSIKSNPYLFVQFQNEATYNMALFQSDHAKIRKNKLNKCDFFIKPLPMEDKLCIVSWNDKHLFLVCKKKISIIIWRVIMLRNFSYDKCAYSWNDLAVFQNNIKKEKIIKKKFKNLNVYMCNIIWKTSSGKGKYWLIILHRQT